MDCSCPQSEIPDRKIKNLYLAKGCFSIDNRQGWFTYVFKDNNRSRTNQVAINLGRNQNFITAASGKGLSYKTLYSNRSNFNSLPSVDSIRLR